jgi:hypothetical protein
MLGIVIPSAARNLLANAARCFASLSMTFDRFCSAWQPRTAEIATGILHAPRLRCTMSGMWQSRTEDSPVRWRPTSRTRCAAVLLALLATSRLLAQPTVELRVGATQPYANEAVRVELRVDGYQECEPPTFPDLKNCTVQYAGSSSGTSFSQIGGGAPQVSKHVTFSYALTAHKAGPLTIPAIPVVVDGKTLKTKPVQLTVRAVPQSPQPGAGQPSQPEDETAKWLLAEITCQEPRLFVGQVARFTLTIWIKPAEYRSSPLSTRSMWQCRVGNLGPFEHSEIGASQLDRPLTDGSTELYYLYELTAEFPLLQVGPLTFDDVGIGMNYPTAFTTSVFGDLRVRRHIPLRVRPNVAVPEVLPLPTEGRPASFSGAVGRYEINAFAVPTNVRVGDPIELVIDISGQPIETIPGPDLAANTELNEDFRVPTEILAGTVRGNSKRFTQTIRAKRADVKNIPPIEFSYFDPQAGQYAVARSEPIPVLVSAVEQLDAADIDVDAQPPQAQDTTLEARDGLRGNKTGELELLVATSPVTITQVLLGTLVPPAVFLGVLSVTALTRSGRDTASRRRRGAVRTAERRVEDALASKLTPAEFHSEVQAALAGYLADRLNQPPARFLGTAGVVFLEQRGVSDELVRQWSDVVQRCEQIAYAGGGESDSSLADAARDCIARLERERL